MFFLFANCFFLIFIVLFLAAHIFKMVRLYLVLIETRIPFTEFLFLYMRTTLVNLIIPFKLGEIYRIIAVTRVTGRKEVGICGVIVDRFFDTVSLLCILIPCELIFIRQVNVIPVILFAGLILLLLIYIFFEPSYQYLNNYIIRFKKSGRAMGVLSGLDMAGEWHNYVRSLVHGRSALMILSSLAGWVFEIFAIKALAAGLHEGFDIYDFDNYINSIFGAGEKIRVSEYYGVIASIIICVATIISLLIWNAEKGRNPGENKK
ncbi:MAG: lysylphosphatidylglycerol synthase domain-containing protein [Lachnospiraceae bacterium]|nr:lysylphosphatidylglycerol synthase domain-containing protein [Lachnospiraceae bacterium]